MLQWVVKTGIALANIFYIVLKYIYLSIYLSIYPSTIYTIVCSAPGVGHPQRPVPAGGGVPLQRVLLRPRLLPLRPLQLDPGRGPGA